MKTNSKIVFLIIFSFCLLQVKAENIAEKVVSKTENFSSKDIAFLKIESKYGQIKIQNWAKEEIEINAYVRVSSNNQETAKKILSNVNINMAEVGNILNVNTEFGTFFSFMKFTNNLFRNGEFSIDYVVKMPTNIATDLVLHNGNIILFERNAKVRIDHSKGTVSIQKIDEKANLKLRNSNLKLDNATNLLLDVRNSNVFIAECNSLKTDSYNTVFQVGKVDKLVAKSMRDTFKIQQLGNISTTSTLSDFKIQELVTSAITETNYGDFTIENLSRNFKEITMKSKGTKLAIFVNKTPANIVINHHLSTKMSIPDALGLNMKFTEMPKYFITKGKVRNPKAGNTIRIKAKGGSLRLK